MLSQGIESCRDLTRRLAAAGVPVTGVSRDRIDYADEATVEQRADGDAILAAWDWNAETVPVEVSPLQAKIALHRAGFLESVETAVAATGEEALIAYRNALVFRRDSPMLQMIAAAVPGLADALNAIFTAAASIEV